jgi:hypothetical protein
MKNQFLTLALLTSVASAAEANLKDALQQFKFAAWEKYATSMRGISQKDASGQIMRDATGKALPAGFALYLDFKPNRQKTDPAIAKRTNFNRAEFATFAWKYLTELSADLQLLQARLAKAELTDDDTKFAEEQFLSTAVVADRRVSGASFSSQLMSRILLESFAELATANFSVDGKTIAPADVKALEKAVTTNLNTVVGLAKQAASRNADSPFGRIISTAVIKNVLRHPITALFALLSSAIRRTAPSTIASNQTLSDSLSAPNADAKLLTAAKDTVAVVATAQNEVGGWLKRTADRIKTILHALAIVADTKPQPLIKAQATQNINAYE